MWRNPNEDDDEIEDDWYSSDTQDFFLDFEDDCHLYMVSDAKSRRIAGWIP